MQSGHLILYLMSRSIGGIRISIVQSSSLRHQIGRLGFSHFQSLIFSVQCLCKQAVGKQTNFLTAQHSLSHLSHLHSHCGSFPAIRLPSFDRLWAFGHCDLIGSIRNSHAHPSTVRFHSLAFLRLPAIGAERLTIVIARIRLL